MTGNRSLFLSLFTLLALVCACLAVMAVLLLGVNVWLRREPAPVAQASAVPSLTVTRTRTPLPTLTRALTTPGGETGTPALPYPGVTLTEQLPLPGTVTVTLTLEGTLVPEGTPSLEGTLLPPTPTTGGETGTPAAPYPGATLAEPSPTIAGETAAPDPGLMQPVSVVTPTLTATIAPLALDAFCIPWNRGGERGRVLRVIDGVTIEVELDGQPAQVRYIGLELPEYESDYSLWQQAYDHNRELVEGQTVALFRDRSDTDAEGRLLRYVLAGVRFINLQMAADGYAIATSMPPDVACDQVLLEAEMQSIARQDGIWAPTPMPTRTFIPPTPTLTAYASVVIARVAPRGDDWQDPNEYVEIYNADTVTVQMRGWTIQDSQNHIFVFPNLVLKPGDYCRVYTNLYNRFHCGLSFYRLSPIWSDDGECAYLKNADGKLVDEFCYEWAERR